MRFHSDNPEVVGNLAPNWTDSIPSSDYFLKVSGLRVIGEGEEPDLSLAKCKYSAEPFMKNEATQEGARPEADMESLTPFLQELIAITDKDYRTVKGIDADQATRHIVQVRSGKGTVTAIRQTRWLNIMHRLGLDYVPKALHKSPVHLDGRPNDALSSAVYALLQGEGTAFWDGDFVLPKIPLGHLALGSQVRGRLPSFVARDDEVIRFMPTAVHQAPLSVYDPNLPRRFVRNEARLDPSSY